MEPRFTRHLRDQIDEDHFQLELLFRAVKVVQSHLYEVEAALASVRNELDDFAVYFGHPRPEPASAALPQPRRRLTKR
jgi:hypothetical protein